MHIGCSSYGDGGNQGLAREGALTFVPIKSAMNVMNMSMHSCAFFQTLDLMGALVELRYFIGLICVTTGVLLILARPLSESELVETSETGESNATGPPRAFWGCIWLSANLTGAVTGCSTQGATVNWLLCRPRAPATRITSRQCHLYRQQILASLLYLRALTSKIHCPMAESTLWRPQRTPIGMKS